MTTQTERERIALEADHQLKLENLTKTELCHQNEADFISGEKTTEELLKRSLEALRLKHSSDLAKI